MIRVVLVPRWQGNAPCFARHVPTPNGISQMDGKMYRPSCGESSFYLIWIITLMSCSFLYALFLAADANFRLRRSLVSSHSVDPGLSSGFSYFVAEEPYKTFLASRSHLPQEVRPSHYQLLQYCLIYHFRKAHAPLTAQ
jgi:hypothetical protein